MKRVTSLQRLAAATTPEARIEFARAFNEALVRLGVEPGEHFLMAHPDALDERVPKAGCCAYCSRPVNPNLDYRRVTGWEKRRSEGGTNALRLREPQDEWACTACVERAVKGVNPAQASLG